MSKAIGIEMEFTGTNNSVGVFLRDVVASQLGDKVDIFIFESGTEDILGPQGIYLVIDEKNPELTLWDRTPDDWKQFGSGDGQGRQAVWRAGDRQCRQLRLFPRQDRRSRQTASRTSPGRWCSTATRRAAGSPTTRPGPIRCPRRRSI